jgi:uncharacterized membrane protein YeaQ/YmgE (transglycosylase-associated protein family)
MGVMDILWTIIIGLIVGVIAKVIMPGRDPGGIIITILLGVAGAFLGTLIGGMLWGGRDYRAGLIMSIIGALLILWLYRLIKGRQTA